VRQIAPAKLALSRRPMEKWMEEQATWRGKEFKLAPEATQAGDIRRQMIVRRRRFAWMFWLGKGYVALGRHDQQRNRLVVVDASSEELAESIMQSVGWAAVAVA